MTWRRHTEGWSASGGEGDKIGSPRLPNRRDFANGLLSWED
jgi:hypothetical protein